MSSINCELNAVCNKTDIITVGSVSAYARYMLHIGYDDKEQFSTQGTCYGGFPLDKCLYDPVQDFEIAEFVDYVFYVLESYPRLTFTQLIQILREEKLYNYIAFSAKNTYFVKSLLS